MILGIGTDLVQQSRISKLLDRFGRKFVERILSLEEILCFEKVLDKEAYLAKRFAGKEAIAKALGTGIGAIAFNEISILNLPNGKPYVKFLGKSQERVAEFAIREVMISLSDEKEYALAFAVISV